MSFRKMAGFAGLSFVVLLIASFIFYGNSPSFSAATAEIAEYVADTDTYLFAGLLSALSVIAMVPFAAGFAVPFLASDREHREGFGVVIVVAFAAAVAAVGLGVAALTALGLRIEELDGPAVRVLWDFSNAAYGFSILLVIPAAAGAALAVMRHGVMPKWFGNLSWGVAAAALAAIPSYLVDGDGAMVLIAGLAGLVIWVLAASILMIREPAETEAKVTAGIRAG